jgi:hypothetical protein
MMRFAISFLTIGLVTLPIGAAEPEKVSVDKTATSIEFRAGKELVTRYHIGAEVAKPFFWPVNAPGELAVTRGWPMQKGLPAEKTDHVHQKSAWFCHGDVIPEGVELKVRSSDRRVKGVDFWAESPGHGKIVCVKVSAAKMNGSSGSIVTVNEWRAPDGTKILDEERTITVKDLGEARLIILDIDLHASVCPITFGDTKEGSMGVRVNDQIRIELPKGSGVITSANGIEVKAQAKDNLPIWGKRADWHDYSGMVDGAVSEGSKVVGIALFDHPKNSPRSAWHTRAYGLMAANPFGRSASFPDAKGDLAKMAKGEHLKLRYGILTHRGTCQTAKVAEHYAAFAKD